MVVKEESGKQPGLVPSCQGEQPSEGGRPLEVEVRGLRPAPSLTSTVGFCNPAASPWRCISALPVPSFSLTLLWNLDVGTEIYMFSLMYANLVTETSLFSLIYANHFNYTCRMMEKNFLSFNCPILVPTHFISCNTYFLFNSYNCFAEH